MSLSTPPPTLTPQAPAKLQKHQTTKINGKQHPQQMSQNISVEEKEKEDKRNDIHTHPQSMLTTLLENPIIQNTNESEEETMINTRICELKQKIFEHTQQLLDIEILEKQLQQQKMDIKNEITTLKNEQGVLKLRREAIVNKNEGDLTDYFLGAKIDSVPWENAKQYKYNRKTDSWDTKQIQIKIDTVVCAYGEQRNVFRCVVKDLPIKFLAKCCIHDSISNSIYFEDVKVQSVAQFYAKKFNLKNPPAKINFVKAWVIELEEREGKPMYGIEQYLEGEFVKHNSNTGYVNKEIQNFTPQAFSHFTYQESNCELLIVDIQGAGYSYTDPQIHSCTGEGFGMGNKGETGIAYFFSTHECNEICKSLGLEPMA